MPKRDNTKQKNGTPPPLPPNDALGFGATERELYAQFRDILGNVATQNALLRSTFGTQRSSIRQAMGQGLRDVENSSIERGVLGGSGDFSQRIDVRSNAASQIAEAANQRNEGLLSSNAQAQQAYRNFRLGVISLMSQKNAEQAQLAAAQSWQQILGGQSPPPGGGPGPGPNPPAPPGNPNGGGGPPQRVLDTLQKYSDQLMTYINQLARTNNAAARQDLMNTINTLWHTRNEMRVTYHLGKPIPRSRLAFLIQQARQDQGPGGSPGGQQ